MLVQCHHLTTSIHGELQQARVVDGYARKEGEHAERLAISLSECRHLTRGIQLVHQLHDGEDVAVQCNGLAQDSLRAVPKLPVDLAVEARVLVRIQNVLTNPRGRHRARDALPTREPDLLPRNAVGNTAVELVPLLVHEEQRRAVRVQQPLGTVKRAARNGLHVPDVRVRQDRHDIQNGVALPLLGNQAVVDAAIAQRDAGEHRKGLEQILIALGVCAW
ncbi:hypothetical protein, conserved in T. vivax [Trypanosoma vivax Y486]|uniref:Uncharacterized protein n=1 Tax=Trypanosoma vivax (strain Y486) TaxID=1055687 RepID=F9WTZ6_TRYVY|nr:hypothetical protein, conserved in T. vivax [Trypanosoma vivax Y486]|eukprot:CCD21042.1 hypothetical protein, conserved in T. vivax [Trypanosoma vivax Y486]